MSIFRNALIVGASVLSMSFAAETPDYESELILDDFNDTYGDAPAQNYPGALKNLAESGSVSTGKNGPWFVIHVGDSTTVTSADSVRINSTNYDKMVKDSVLHVFMCGDNKNLKDENGDTIQKYPSVLICTNILEDSNTVVDLSNLTKITFKAKGSAYAKLKLRVHTLDVDRIGDWGYYSKTFELTSDWETFEFPVDSLLPGQWSLSADSLHNFTWDNGKTLAYAVSFQQETKEDVEFYLDDIKFVGMKYSDIITPVSVKPTAKFTKNLNAFTVSNSSIAYNMNSAQNVKITMFDAQGSVVRKLFSGNATAGKNILAWSSKGIAKGSYTVVMSSKTGTIAQQQITIVK